MREIENIGLTEISKMLPKFKGIDGSTFFRKMLTFDVEWKFVFLHLSLVFLKVFLLLILFLYPESQFTLCKFLFLLIPFCNNVSHTNCVRATFATNSRL